MDRKEKLEEAKRLYETANADQKYVLESLFPELAETEDERIRKELIEFVKSRGGFKQEYIAWLEKQGEQKLTNNQFTPEQADILDKHIDKFLEQKLAWSEEDEKYTNIALAALYSPSAEGLYSFHKVKSSDVTNWFISLKDRVRLPSQWKPSDEQMETLKSSTYCQSEQMSKVLFELYQDLKKLREK